VAEVVDCVVGGFQGVAAGMEDDFSLAGEGHEVGEVLRVG
jgi:hypothetical protein